MSRAADSEAAARTAAAWREASERGDAQAASRCLAEDVVLISPLTARFRFEGRRDVEDVVVAAFAVIGDIRFHTEVGDAATRALFYRGRCGKQEFEEAQLLRLDADGLIAELTLFGRPLPGLTAVMDAIGPPLLRRQGRPAMARAVAVATKPLRALAQLGERRVVPFAAPRPRP